MNLLVQVSSSQELYGIIYVWSLLFLPAILYSAPAAAIVWEFDMVLIGIDGMLLNAPLTATVLLLHRYQLSSCLWDLVSAALSWLAACMACVNSFTQRSRQWIRLSIHEQYHFLHTSAVNAYYFCFEGPCAGSLDPDWLVSGVAAYKLKKRNILRSIFNLCI